MTPENKKLWLYGGGAAALTFLVYFIFFKRPAVNKTPIINPPVPDNQDTIYYPDYPDVLSNTDVIPAVKHSMIVEAKSGTRLRKEPNTDSTIVKTYKGGEQFFVNEKKTMIDGDWYHLTNGSGWVRSDVVNIINAGFFGGL